VEGSALATVVAATEGAEGGGWASAAEAMLGPAATHAPGCSCGLHKMAGMSMFEMAAKRKAFREARQVPSNDEHEDAAASSGDAGENVTRLLAALKVADESALSNAAAAEVAVAAEAGAAAATTTVGSVSRGAAAATEGAEGGGWASAAEAMLGPAATHAPGCSCGLHKMAGMSMFEMAAKRKAFREAQARGQKGGGAV
jgi:hypothetical protein